jgi:Zn-dependent protease
MGTVVVPLLSFALNGWMLGWANAPYDPVWAERHPRREVAMALAGPAANLALVVLAGLLVRAGLLAGLLAPPNTVTFTHVADVTAAGGGLGGVVTLLSILFSLNLILFAFNLLPLPPMDGSAVLPLLMSEETARRYKGFLAAQPMLSLVGLLLAWQLFPPVFTHLQILALKVLYPGLGYG